MELALIGGASGGLQQPCRGKEADLWRVVPNVMLSYPGLEENSGKNENQLTAKPGSASLNSIDLWRQYVVWSDLKLSVNSVDHTGHRKAGLLTNNGSLDLELMGTPLPFSSCFPLHSSFFFNAHVREK